MQHASITSGSRFSATPVALLVIDSLCIPTQALRARLLSTCPSGTQALRARLLSTCPSGTKGTSCQATINLSFRDKSHSPIEAPHNYLNAYAGTTGGLRPGGTPEYRRAINPEDIVLQGR
jgi:hypothetical protein